MGSGKLLVKRIGAGIWFLNLVIAIENHARLPELSDRLLSDFICVVSFVALISILTDLFAAPRSSRGGEDA